MTDIFILLIFAILMLMLLVAYAFLSHIRTKRKYSKMKKVFELSLQIIEVRNSVYSHRDSLKNFRLLNSYVEDVEVLFSNYVINIDAIKVERIGLLNKNRQNLIKEFESAPNYIRGVVRSYSLLLSNIYEYNHPYKHFFHSLQKSFIVFLLHAMVVLCRILICLLKYIDSVCSIGKALKTSSDAKKSMDAKTISTETYSFQIIEC